MSRSPEPIAGTPRAVARSHLLALGAGAPHIELAIVSNRLDVQTIGGCCAMHCGTKVRQTDPPYLRKRNLQGRPRLQRRQLLHDALNQVMVLSMSTCLQFENLALPILSNRPLTLGFLFIRHNLTSFFEAKY